MHIQLHVEIPLSKHVCFHTLPRERNPKMMYCMFQCIAVCEFVCECECIYTLTHAHTHTNACINRSMNVSIYICTYIYMYIYIYIHVYIYICKYVYTHMCISDVIMRRFLPTKNQYSLRSLVSTKLQHWHLRLLHLPLRTHRAPRRWLWH